MDPLQATLIPASYVNFAKAVGALADSHGIKTVMLKITPDWKDEMPNGQRVHGDVQINYTSKDGRGRPCVNLEVFANVHTTLAIIDNPESSN